MTFDIDFWCDGVHVLLEFDDFTQPGYSASRLDALVTIGAGKSQASRSVVMWPEDFMTFAKSLLMVHDSFRGKVELRPTPEYDDFLLTLHFGPACNFAVSGFLQTQARGRVVGSNPSARLEFESGGFYGDDCEDDSAGGSGNYEELVLQVLDLVSLIKAYSQPGLWD